MKPVVWAVAMGVAGCAGRPGPPVVVPTPEQPPLAVPADTQEHRPRLPPVPLVRGPLRIRVVYPDPTARVEVADSSFVLGSVGDGTATLRIDGHSIPVAPNGGWLAWIPFRGDSVVTLVLEARTETDSARLEYRVRRVRRFTPPRGDRVWVDTTSMSPAGRVWWPDDEFLPLSVRAAPGAELRLELPGGPVVPFAADSMADLVPEAVRAFDRDTAKLIRPVRADRYRAVLRGARLGDPGPLLGSRPGPPGAPLLVAVRGRDTLRVRWPLRLAPLDSVPRVVELDDDRDRRGGTDGITMGRAVPGGTYTWFFPAGTRARVTGRINGDLRIALSRRSEAWVSAAEAFPSSGLAQSVIGSITLTPRDTRVEARIPAGVRVPFQVLEEPRALTLVLYGARTDVNWLRYGPEDPLLRLVTTRQSSADELELRFELTAPVWGYRAFWRGTDLLFEIRRPPALERRNRLDGLTIVLDPGHPPLGATGPTGLTEAEANLAVALALAPLLERQGARVLLTRTGPEPLDLVARIRFADSVDAHLLVSIHNNALPDGVNPFANNGSSVFYHHPRALPLARAIQDRLVHRFGLRDLGVGRADLALARPTWMPAVLTEGLFLMIPEQEAALRDPEGQRGYALAVLEGIQRFLARRDEGPW